MFNFSRDLGERYSPLYFLNAFAAGGIAISFFMYIFWCGQSMYGGIPTINLVFTLLADEGFLTGLLCAASLVGFLGFAAIHVILMHWNILSYRRWQKTSPYRIFEKSTDKTVLLMAIPAGVISLTLFQLTLLLFFPYTMDIAEFLLGFGLFAMAFQGYKAASIYFSFLSPLLTQTSIEEGKTNSLGQMISLFSFTMLFLGFAVIAGLSTSRVILVPSILLAFFCGVCVFGISLFWFLPKGLLFSKNKLSAELAPLLCFASAILCLFGLADYYKDRALLYFWGNYGAPGTLFEEFSIIFAACVLLNLFGKTAAQTHGFYNRLIKGELYASGLYAVVTPAILFMILGHYYINIGLVQATIIQPFSAVYFILYVPILALQVFVVRLFFRLNAKLFPQQARRIPPASQQ